MEDVYEKLRQHFNEGPISKLRKTKELMQILEILFTPEQAECAVNIPLSIMGRISLEDLARRLNKGFEEVEKEVEAMAREGKVQAMTDTGDGKKYYVPCFPCCQESLGAYSHHNI